MNVNKINKIKHPAKFSNELLPNMAKYCYGDVIDIMGGTGKAGLFKKFNKEIHSVTINELEPEWASQAKENGVDMIIVGDARNLTGKYDVIVTSPPYGNRMADNFKPSKLDSMRRSYTGDLGRTPTVGSVCCLHFGKEYKVQIADIFLCLIKNISHSRIVLNTSNFIRNFKEIDVFSFYENLFISYGYKITQHEKIETKRHKGVGTNTHLRVKYEDVAVYDK